MTDFVDTWACVSRAHCRECRTQHTIADWRAQKSAPDECPNGVTADDLPPLVSPDPLFAARRREICQECGWTCDLDKHNGCYVKKYLRTPGSMCPEGHWKAERH